MLTTLCTILRSEGSALLLCNTPPGTSTPSIDDNTTHAGRECVYVTLSLRVSHPTPFHYTFSTTQTSTHMTHPFPFDMHHQCSGSQSYQAIYQGTGLGWPGIQEGNTPFPSPSHTFLISLYLTNSVNTPFGHTLSIHPCNTLYPHSLQANSVSYLPPCQYPALVMESNPHHTPPTIVFLRSWKLV